MIPVLFESTATDFTTQGIGALTDAISCTVTEERNGVYELEMQYPVTGIHFEDIQDRAIIAAIPSPYRERQPFRIYKITRPLEGTVTIYAAHLSYDLNSIPVMTFSATGIANAFMQLKNNMTIDNNFTFISALTNTASRVEYPIPYACRSILGGIDGSILDIFGGEYEFDGWTVRLWAERGSNNGVTIRYGKNMTALNAETDSENVVTGIYPYWYKDDVLVEADPRIIWVDDAPYQKAVTVDFTTDFEEQPTAAQLTARAESYINSNDIGTVPISIEVSFVDLSKMSGYEGITAALEECDLCDTITIQYEALGIDVESQIVQIVTDVLQERYESMQVGTIRADIAQTIAETANKIDSVVRTDGSLIAEALRGFIDVSLVNLYAQYDAASSAGVEAILFENNDTSSALYGALAIGTQGLMIAKEKKSDGTGWNWTTALTSEGLMASIIVAGILTDKLGKNYWNLDTGDMVTTQGTIGGWTINSENLQSPSGNMVLDAEAGEIYTVKDGGIPGVIIGDDDITIYTWDEQIAGTLSTRHYADAQNTIPYIGIFGTGDIRLWPGGSNNELGSAQTYGITIGGMESATPGVRLPSSMTYIGRYLAPSQRSSNNRIQFQWTGSALQLYIDDTLIGTFQIS